MYVSRLYSSPERAFAGGSCTQQSKLPSSSAGSTSVASQHTFHTKVSCAGLGRLFVDAYGGARGVGGGPPGPWASYELPVAAKVLGSQRPKPPAVAHAPEVLVRIEAAYPLEHWGLSGVVSTVGSPDALVPKILKLVTPEACAATDADGYAPLVEAPAAGPDQREQQGEKENKSLELISC